MDTLNQMELQNIRHNCGACSTACKKLDYYKTITNDESTIDVMNKICTACENLKQELINML